LHDGDTAQKTNHFLPEFLKATLGIITDAIIEVKIFSKVCLLFTDFQKVSSISVSVYQENFYL